MLKQRDWPFLLIFLVGAVMGVVSIIAPIYITDVKNYDSPLFPAVRTGIEGMSLWTLFFLFNTGFFLGISHPRREILLGISTISLLPVLAFMEMIADAYSHNLWPIEFVIYGFCAVPGIIGAFVGSFLIKKISQ